MRIPICCCIKMDTAMRRIGGIHIQRLNEGVEKIGRGQHLSWKQKYVLHSVFQQLWIISLLNMLLINLHNLSTLIRRKVSLLMPMPDTVKYFCLVFKTRKVAEGRLFCELMYLIYTYSTKWLIIIVECLKKMFHT